jgi:hypothetical protein
MEDFTSGTLDRKNLMYIREHSYICSREIPVTRSTYIFSNIYSMYES